MVISTGDGDLGLILVIPGGGEDSEIVGEASHINSVVSFVVLSVGGVRATCGFSVAACAAACLVFSKSLWAAPMAFI